jgi:hypothetical protein
MVRYDWDDWVRLGKKILHFSKTTNDTFKESMQILLMGDEAKSVSV